MNYKDLNLHINNDMYSIEVQGKKINIKKYLPINDKKDLIEITLQKAEEPNGTYNEILIDMYFNLYLIYLYTDIIFTDEDREDEMKLYDQLESSGLLEKIILKIPDNEYDTLMGYLEIMRKEDSSYKHSAAAMVQKMIVDLPKNAEAAAKIVENFNKEKYQEVINFSQHANGNRPIPFKQEQG